MIQTGFSTPKVESPIHDSNCEAHMTSSIRTVVIPVAGLGTRFLPATKAVSKEMLPVVDRPLIQYAVEEAVSAGIRQFVFVVSTESSLVDKHFARNAELEEVLNQNNKRKEMNAVRNSTLSKECMHFVIQDKPLGLGHAVLCAKEYAQEDYFAVILPDDLVLNNISCLKQMVEVHHAYSGSVLAIEEADRSRVNCYGIVVPGTVENDVVQIAGIVEKPQPDSAPSNLAAIGRYVLSRQIFALLEEQRSDFGGEIQLTDSINELADSESVHALKFQGTRYDCGTKAGYVAANIAYALNNPEIADQIAEFIYGKCRKLP